MNLFGHDMMESTLGRPLANSDYTDNGNTNGRKICDGVQTSGRSLTAQTAAELRRLKAPTALRLCQNTLIELLGELESFDRLGIVTFSSAASVHLPLQYVTDKASIVRSIEGLRSDGGTNVEAALETSFNHLLEMTKQGDISRLTEVWFLTDGIPTHGTADPLALKIKLEALIDRQAESAGQRPTLSSIGYGDNVQQDILRMFGDEGGGQMHMIGSSSKTTVSSQDIKKLLDKLLEKAKSTLCKNVIIHCLVKGGEFIGDPLTSFCFMPDSATCCIITIDDLRKNEDRSLIVRYRPIEVNCYVYFEIQFYNVISAKLESKTITEGRAFPYDDEKIAIPM